MRIHLGLAGVLIVAVLCSGCQGRKQEGEPSRIATPEKVGPLAEGERLTSFGQRLESTVNRLELKPGATANVAFTTTNTGTQPWYGRAKQLWVDSAYRVVDMKGNLIEDGKRAILNRSIVNPGESDHLALTVTAPKQPGEYRLIISMVQEGATWFFSEGTDPLIIPLVVVPAR
jgi:hypothetical protein